MTESEFEIRTRNLICSIASEQTQSATSELSAGLFPSYRVNRGLLYRRMDENFFFTAIICYVLQTYRGKLPVPNQKIIDSILNSARPARRLFRNKDGKATYNFYRTQPTNHFPNGYFLSRFDYFRLADDADDTAMINLVFGATQEEKLQISNLLSKHSNGSTKWNKSYFPELRSLKAYSTWFGIKMRVEFDASVISNVLLWKYHSGLEWNENDTASFNLLKVVIEKKYWISDPFLCSPNYPRAELILYHFARLISEVRPQLLSPFTDNLISSALELIKTRLDPMNQLLIQTSLLKLGFRSKTSNWIPAEKSLSLNSSGFSFFIAPMLLAYDWKLINPITRNSLVQIKWVCPAFNTALLLEHLILETQPA